MSSRQASSSVELAELLVQLGRAAYAQCGAGDLTPAQWIALRFFARANRFSRTISAFADFHSTTRGTASQTVRGLVERDLLARHPSSRDGRSIIFDLTSQGRRTLQRDPLNHLSRLSRRLGSQREQAVADALRKIRDWLAAERRDPTVGSCARCGHLQTDDSKFSCGLLNEPLADDELGEYCLRYSPPAGNS